MEGNLNQEQSILPYLLIYKLNLFKLPKIYFMITKQQALTEDYFTHATLTNKDRLKTPLRVRRTGKTQTWKTRPEEFKIPVKYGLRESTYITNNNAHEWNVAE